MNENLIVDLERRGIITATFRRLESAKKQKIYQAALDAFANDSFHSVTLDGICRASAVSKGSLIQYFTLKENLLNFACEIYLEEYQSYWDDYFGRELAIRAKERIFGYFRARLEFWEKFRTKFRFYIKMHYENESGLSRNFTERISRLRREYLSAIISRGIETGEIRRDIEPEAISFVLSAATHNLELALLAGLSSPKEKSDLDNLSEQIAAVILDGIRG